MREFLSRRNYFWAELFFLLAVQVFASCVLAGPFIARSTLVLDGMSNFSFFRDNLHSLNYFGEIQWWNPNNFPGNPSSNFALGFPNYYPSILAINGSTPLFVLLGTFVWVLGLIRIHVAVFLPLYVIYFGFLIPALMSFGLLLLARQIISNHRVIFFILLVSCFSPAVMLCLSNSLGVELMAYGLFFVTAFLCFLKKPHTHSFLGLALSILVLASCCVLGSLQWNVLFIPMFVLLVFLTDRGGPFARVKDAIRSVPGWYWLGLLVLCLVCLSPVAITVFQGERIGIERLSLGAKIYPISLLRTGSPLEVLSAGIPGIGFKWLSPTEWRTPWIMSKNGFYDVVYLYMGMLVLPLAFFGLCFGKRIWRTRLMLLAVFFFTIVPLVAFSPIFASLLALIAPLRTNNHFSHLTFRIGGWLILLLLAGIGLDCLLRASGKLWRLLSLIFAFIAVVSMSLFVTLYRGSALENPVFGFGVAMAVFYFVVLTWFARARTRESKNRAMTFLLILTLVDVSTVAFYHLRTNTLLAEYKIGEPPVDAVGMGNVMASETANCFLQLRELRNLKEYGMDFSALPLLGLYDKTGLNAPGDWEKPPQSSGSVTVRYKTYASIGLKVETDKPSILFWRDAYSPYWKAMVNGDTARIIKAFGGFKAVTLPAGTSTVDFRFTPPFVAGALLATYFILFVVGTLWILSFRSMNAK